MKILQIIPSLGIGGAETMMCNLSCELVKKGQQVVVVTFYETSSFIYERLKKNNIKVLCINKKKGFSIKTLKILKRVIKNEKPDVIHTHLHVLPYVWLVSGKIRIIHTLHTIASKEQEGLGKKICGFIYKYSKKCIPVAISEIVKHSFDKEYNYVFNMPIVENGVPVDEIEKKESYDFKNSINIFHVGRFIDVKNHSLMIYAVKQLISRYPNLEIHFFGDGDLKNKLKQIVSRDGLDNSVIFEGVKHDLGKELKQADMFILPSQYEGVPLSLIEAMSARTSLYCF